VAKAFLRLPAGVTYPDPQRDIECEGTTVGEVLDAAMTLLPRLKPRVFADDGTLWVGVFVNGLNVRHGQGLDTPVSDGDKIMVVPPISGG
jgi:MoaD family protein